MLTQVQNEMLTGVGPTTPGGQWLRRYWHPIGISDRWEGIKTLWKCDAPVTLKGQGNTVAEWGKRLGNFEGKPTAVRVLGEDLVLFRDGSGRLGLLGLHCSHRGASLEFGKVRADSLECLYHGWRFNAEGACLDQPNEPPSSRFKEKVTHLAYPVREMGGLIWAYLGPGAPPVLPQVDVIAREDGVRAVENFGLWPVNYVQIVENVVDQTHTTFTHGGSEGERSDIWGTEVPECTWEESEYGIMAKQVRRSRNNIRIAHYLGRVMPTISLIPQPWPGGRFRWPQMRMSALMHTPVDDTHTLVLSTIFTPAVDGRTPELPPGLKFDIADQLHNHRWQDYYAVVSAGEVFDRSTEHIGAADGGVILMRKMYLEGIQAVQRGEDPKGIYRDQAMERLLPLGAVATDDLLLPAPA